jgi:hypothetical protein
MAKDKGSRSVEDSQEWKQFKAVSGGLAPFSIGYQYVKFRGQKVKSINVETFSVSNRPTALVIGSVVVVLISWTFLKTPIPFLNHFVTALLGVNATLMVGNHLRSGGLRQLTMHMTDGRRSVAYVSAYTADAMVSVWNDILVIMPDMAGRDT